MIDIEILGIADVLTALMLASGFLATYLVERRLAAFRWWAGFYALIALSISTTVLEPKTSSVLEEAISWIFLYSAVSFAAFGMYKEGERQTRPHTSIGAGALLLASIIAALVILEAPHSAWVFWGAVPTVLFGFWSILHLVGERSHNAGNWSYGIGLLAGTVLIAARSIWFAANASQVNAPDFNTSPLWNGEPPHFPPQFTQAPSIEQPLILSLATILVMCGLATALTLRVLLSAVRRISARATTDAMTGLLNRAAFDERAAAAINSAGRRSVSAIIFDIDHFKRVNDTCGHPAGDRVIAGIGAIMSEACDERQIAGRIGGEEFAIILPDSTAAAARLLAEAIRTAVSARDFGADLPFPVTLSAGVAEREDKEELHTLVSRADQALYAAKHRGRNRVMTASSHPERATGHPTDMSASWHKTGSL